MAFTYGFYNYKAGDPTPKLYDAEQMSQLFDGLITDGVYGHVGSCFSVHSTNVDGVVTIGSGRAWFDHTWTYNSSDYIMNGDQIAPPAPTFGDRIDAIVIDIDKRGEVRENKFLWVYELGSDSGTPTRPTLINEENHIQHAIAYVTRHANVSTIAQTDIVSVVGTPETPYVTGILETLDTSEIISQFEHDFEDYISSLPKTTTYQMPLAAGQTTVTFTNVTIPENSLVTVGTSVIGLDYNNMTRNGNNITIIFDAQSYAATVYLFVMETFYPITPQQ